jgi:hypothetical protein
LALHSKQNSSETTTTSSDNDDKSSQQPRKNLNPFATEEDDDSDNEDDNERDFSIGDLDVEDNGRGLLADGEAGEDKGKNVNVGTPPAMSSSTNTNTTIPLGIGRASFPSMWPFGTNTSPSHKEASFAVEGGVGDEGTHDHQSNSHFKGSSANGNHVQSDESDSSNSSDEELGYGDRDLERESRETEFGGYGQGKRRLSVTTEAKRRTSLEDDDEEEDGVVHVGMEVEKDIAVETEGGDEGELVEIQHAEMQGVEEEAARK